MIHVSVTHNLVMNYCNQAELDSLQCKSYVRQGGVDAEEFTCTICDKRFFSSYLLRIHNTSKHFYKKLYAEFSSSVSSGVCQICGKKYLASRMIQHLGDAHNEVAKHLVFSG